MHGLLVSLCCDSDGSGILNKTRFSSCSTSMSGYRGQGSSESFSMERKNVAKLQGLGAEPTMHHSAAQFFLTLPLPETQGHSEFVSLPQRFYASARIEVTKGVKLAAVAFNTALGGVRRKGEMALLGEGRSWWRDIGGWWKTFAWSLSGVDFALPLSRCHKDSLWTDVHSNGTLRSAFP